MKIEINSLQELERFANHIAKCLKGNEIILLKGELAAGKTTFVRLLVSSIDKTAEDLVNSPTFSIMNEYETKKFIIYHLDLYRVRDFDFSDIIGHGIIIIEWADEEIFKQITGFPVIFIEIEVKNEKRIFHIKIKDGDYLEKCLKY
jgi:tRNA threonylcarbamoyladenosine biosynthesis protein TsaE